MKIKCLFSLLWLSVNAQALEVSANIYNKPEISVTVADVHLPDDIVKNELSSGLPNRIDLVVDLSVNDNIVETYISSRIVTYDLWDEKYLVQIIDRQALDTLVFEARQQLMEYLSTISLSGISIPPVLTGSGSSAVKLGAEVIFNPVQRERIERIKDWLDKRGGYNRNATESSLDLSATTQVLSGSHIEGIKSHGPRFQKLFDQILEQYMASDNIAAQWRSGRKEVFLAPAGDIH